MTAAVRAAVARAPIHVSRERAADRRASVASAFGVDFGRAADRRAKVTRVISQKVAPVTAAVRSAVARAPIHVSSERAADRRAGAASALGVDFERAAERRAAVVRGVTAGSLYLSPIGVAAAAPGEPDKGDVRERMIAAGVLPDTPTTLTTGVDGEPGQPDRAGDVHAYVGIPTTPPGSRGEDAPGEPASFWGIDFDLAAERRGEIFEKGIWGAPKQILTGISDMGAKPRAGMESRMEAVTARQQAKFQPGTLSDLTTGFSEKMSRVAAVARGFESEDQVAYVPAVAQKYLGAPAQFTVPSVKSLVYGTEEKLGLHAEWIPAPLKTAGWAAKEAVYGAAFSGTAGAVEMVGMVPVAFEAMAKRRDIIPAAVAVGLVTMGKGMYHGATTSPTRLAGEFATFGVLLKGGGKVTAPLTPKIIRGEGYVGVGIKGRTKATYKTVDVSATPKEFLKSEMAAGRIKGVRQKPFTKRPAGKEPVGTARLDVGEPAAMTKPTEIFISPKTYGYSVLRKVADPLMKLTKMDIAQQRRFRADHPTHQEVLAHELFHHKSKQFSEGNVQKLTREFAEAPSQKVFTIPKQVKVGHTHTPKPIIGIRTGKFTTPEGVTTTYKGLQVGKGWTPAELTKTYRTESVTGAEGTALAMEKLTQARLGQLRYEHSGFARGKIDPGYFLPEAAKASPKGMPELMTAEKGLTVTGRNLPSVDVIKPPSPPKPTRLYAEISQPYMKAVDAPLSGSPAHIRWVEAGFRKVSYGVKGAPGVKGGKQARFEVEAEPWGTHPSTQTALGQTRAMVPYQPPIGVPISMVVRPTTTFIPTATGGGILPSAPPVRQIPRSMYFRPEGAPSSRFYDAAHAKRPTAPVRETPDISWAEEFEVAVNAYAWDAVRRSRRSLADMPATDVLKTAKSVPQKSKPKPEKVVAKISLEEMFEASDLTKQYKRRYEGSGKEALERKHSVPDTGSEPIPLAEGGAGHSTPPSKGPRVGVAERYSGPELTGDGVMAHLLESKGVVRKPLFEFLTDPQAPAGHQTPSKPPATTSSARIQEIRDAVAESREYAAEMSKPHASRKTKYQDSEYQSPEPAPGTRTRGRTKTPRKTKYWGAGNRDGEPRDARKRTLTPWVTPAFTPAPTEGEEDEERRKWFIMPQPDPVPVPDRDPAQDQRPDPDPDPVPDPDPDPYPDDHRKDDSFPDEWRPPPTPPDDVIVDDPPPVPKPKSLKEKKEKPIRRKLKPRGPFDWFLKHDMMTLEGFLGGVAKPASGAFPEPDLASPAAAKKAGGKRARRPGLLDVPEGW